MTSMCALHYNGDMATIVRFIGSPHVHQDINTPDVLAKLKPVLTNDVYDDIARILTTRAPAHCQQRKTHKCSKAPSWSKANEVLPKSWIQLSSILRSIHTWHRKAWLIFYITEESLAQYPTVAFAHGQELTLSMFGSAKWTKQHSTSQICSTNFAFCIWAWPSPIRKMIATQATMMSSPPFLESISTQTCWCDA